MRYYIEHLPMTIPMGVQSENNAETVEFDVSDWLARDGSLSFSVWVTRPGETEAYQAANTTLKDGILYWWPTSADTAIAGEGRVEILAVSANRRMLSGWTETTIRETTTETTTDAPVDQRPWLDQALLASEEAKAAAASAAASADQADGVVKKEIATLTEDMAELEDSLAVERKTNNMFDKSAASLDTFLDPSTGLTRTMNGYLTSDYMAAEPGKTVYIYDKTTDSTLCAHFAVYFDADKNLIGKSAEWVSAAVIPDGCKYVRITAPVVRFSLNNGMVSYIDNLDYEPYGVWLDPKIPNVITVGKSKRYDYMTITEAVAHASENDIVYVFEGVYENETIRAWEKTVHVRGVSKERCIIKNDYNTYSAPPAELASGTFENLTFYAADTGKTSADANGWLPYAVHIESNYLSGKSLEFNNCRFRCDANKAVGIGLRKDCVVAFNNCEFVSRDSQALFFHDSAIAAYVGENQNISIKNCVIVSETSNYAMRIDSQGANGAAVNCEFIGNSFACLNHDATAFMLVNGDSWVSKVSELRNFSVSKTTFNNSVPIQ